VAELADALDSGFQNRAFHRVTLRFNKSDKTLVFTAWNCAFLHFTELDSKVRLLSQLLSQSSYRTHGTGGVLLILAG
jgi:hypothetical protein